MSLFPMFLKLEGRSCLVVGAGKIAEGKIRSLLVARGESPRGGALGDAGGIWMGPRGSCYVGKPVSSSWKTCNETFLVIAATSSVDVNEASLSRGHTCGRFYAM